MSRHPLMHRSSCAVLRHLLWIVLLPMPVFLSAWDWPSTEPRMHSGFGHSDGTNVSRGVVLQSEDEIEAIHPGEVVFIQNRATHILGRFVMVEHEGNLRSLYSHLGEIVLRDTTVNTGRPLARADETSGYSRSEGFGLRIIDRLQGGYVNPVALLPPISDNAAPIIDSIALVGETTYPLNEQQEANIVHGGTFDLLVGISDYQSRRGRRTTPLPAYGIEVVLDELPPIRLLYEVIDEREGALYLLPATPLEEIGRAPRRVRLGPLRLAPGSHRLNLRVWDAAGNSATQQIDFTAVGHP